MRGLVFTGPGRVELQELSEPQAGPDEVVLRVEAAGICGSELHDVRHPSLRLPPLVLGHEIVGTTASGERVAVNPLVACSECERCREGRSNLCERRSVVGIHRPGGMAEAVAVPRSACHALPAGLTLEAASIVEPLANGIHAWGLAADRMPRRVAVLGAGTIGLMCLAAARFGGAEEIHVTDLSLARLEVAGRLGADRVGEALDGRFDAVIDAVGVPPTRAASVARLRPGGVAVWIGLESGSAAFDAQELVRSEKAVLGSYAYRPADVAAAAELAPHLDTSWVQTFPLDGGAAVFHELMAGRTDIVKAVLVPG